MGIETATYISGLTATWPPSGDPKAQGDDHIRLIKSTLQSTFPNASKPLYLPSVTALNGPSSLTLTAAHDRTTLVVSTTGGVATVTLPSLTVADAGWAIEVVKYTTDANTVLVQPASGTIYTQFGTVATMRLGMVCASLRLVWTGAIWISSRDGPMIGSTQNFDGPTLPAGYLTLDGSAYVAATYTELYLALGSVATLKDKRGRTDIGSGTGAGLSARVLGTTYGAETLTLTPSNIPSLTSSGVNLISMTGNALLSLNISGVGWGPGGNGPPAISGNSGASTSPTNNSISVAYTNASPTANGLLQPSIGTQKIIRAC